MLREEKKRVEVGGWRGRTWQTLRFGMCQDLFLGWDAMTSGGEGRVGATLPRKREEREGGGVTEKRVSRERQELQLNLIMTV